MLHLQTEHIHNLNIPWDAYVNVTEGNTLGFTTISLRQHHCFGHETMSRKYTQHSILAFIPILLKSYKKNTVNLMFETYEWFLIDHGMTYTKPYVMLFNVYISARLQIHSFHVNTCLDLLIQNNQYICVLIMP